MTLAFNSILENRYRIDKQFGQGGYGAVYWTANIRLYMTCAINKQESEMLAK